LRRQFPLYGTPLHPFSVLGFSRRRWQLAGLAMGSQQNALHQLVSFILGASAAAVLLFFLTSATSGARFTGISSWANGTTALDAAPAQEASPAGEPAAPAHAEAKVTFFSGRKGSSFC